MERKTSFASNLAALLLVASVVSSPVLAQGSAIGKGSLIISGSAGAFSEHNEASGQVLTSISLAPSVLYFVRPGLAIGGAVNAGYLSVSRGTSKSFGVGPSLRYYFGDQSAKTFPFVSATVAPTWTSSSFKNSSATSSSGTNTLLEGTAGFTHLIVAHVGITGEAFYDHLSSTNDVGTVHVDQRQYAFGVRFGVTAFVY